MTVCIAAIYNNSTIVGISDRMITAGDIEFEPQQKKIFELTNSIAIMTAGDTNIQAQVFFKTLEIVIERIKANRDIWIPVEDVANMYGQNFLNLRTKKIENEILSPYMLNHESFISLQQQMNSVFIREIMEKIDNFSNIEDIETIITGIDTLGPHIYVVRNSEIICYDNIGFASIGFGSNQALSHFMLSGYIKSSSPSKALLTIHQAKKKAEVSPGVGKQTDMFVIGPLLGSFAMIVPFGEIDLIKDLDKFYDEYLEEIKKLDENNESKIEEYVMNLVKTSTPEQEPGSSTSPSASPSPSPEPEEGD